MRDQPCKAKGQIHVDYTDQDAEFLEWLASADPSPVIQTFSDAPGVFQRDVSPDIDTNCSPGTCRKASSHLERLSLDVMWTRVLAAVFYMTGSNPSYTNMVMRCPVASDQGASGA